MRLYPDAAGQCAAATRPDGALGRRPDRAGHGGACRGLCAGLRLSAEPDRGEPAALSGECPVEAGCLSRYGKGEPDGCATAGHGGRHQRPACRGGGGAGGAGCRAGACGTDRDDQPVGLVDRGHPACAGAGGDFRADCGGRRLCAAGAGGPARPSGHPDRRQQHPCHLAPAGRGRIAGVQLSGRATGGECRLCGADLAGSLADRCAERAVLRDRDADPAVRSLYRHRDFGGAAIGDGLRRGAGLVACAVDGGAVRGGGADHVERRGAAFLWPPDRAEPACGDRFRHVLDLALGADGVDHRHAADRLPGGDRASCAQPAGLFDPAGRQPGSGGNGAAL